MPSGRVLHGAHEGVHVLRFVGEIRYPLAPAVTKLMSTFFEEGELVGLVADLCETTSIDSTNLGMLARFGNRLARQRGGRLTLVCDRAELLELLESMGFRDFFEIVETKRGEPALADEHVEAGAIDPAELGRVMLAAHRTLMEMSEENRETFREVVASLERDLQMGSDPDT
ncbi:MAG: STAS domain-containing protein [Deltaproteobacteria bacterium]|nr:STAS domain-containing protein [Deltaproteobacteria bacterium]